MANKRRLKKEIAYICGDAASQCILAGELFEKADRDALSQSIIKLAMLQGKTMRLVNISFDKAPRDFETIADYHRGRHEYFRTAYTKLREKFNTELRGILHEMNEAVPRDEKDK